YKNVNIYIKQAKDAGMVVSKIEAQMPAFKKKILHQDLHEALVGQSYDFLKSAVVAAKADGIDVSRIEKEMPKLQKKMLREAAYSVFEEIKADSYPTEAGWNLLQQNIKAAKDAGVDVSRIEKEMPKLQKKIH
ncbi:hypothetical protein KBC86_03540, partial [Candidatus Gracilibacteria bacterium]|nr:hypothetical protein [Candidatus Gracilibacteria bacterium]